MICDKIGFRNQLGTLTAMPTPIPSVYHPLYQNEDKFIVLVAFDITKDRTINKRTESEIIFMGTKVLIYYKDTTI